MIQKDKKVLTEIDRENWRYSLYSSQNEKLYGDFTYSPKSFIDLSLLIELNTEEIEIYRMGRNQFLNLCDRIKFNYKNYLDRQIDRREFQLIIRPHYRIVSIDLADSKTIEDLHYAFKKSLFFPDNYAMNWLAFWDCITKLVKMPSNLILYNFLSLQEIDKEQAGILRKLINDYNKIDVKYQINFDHVNELPNIKSVSNLSSLFARRPFQYYFRGDKPLWDELERAFEMLPIAETEDELVTQIIQSIEKLTHFNVLQKDKYFVNRYNTGGMTGGFISSQFWLSNAIPIIVNRYREMLKAGNKVQ